MIIPTLRPIAHVIRMLISRATRKPNLADASIMSWLSVPGLPFLAADPQLRHPALERRRLHAEQLRGASGSAHPPAGRTRDGSDVVHFDPASFRPFGRVSALARGVGIVNRGPLEMITACSMTRCGSSRMFPAMP